MIPEWAVQFNAAGCQSCKNKSIHMDKWGPDGCEQRREGIVAHLLEQGDELVKPLALLPESVKKAVAGRLLTIAIARAKEAEGPDLSALRK